VGRLQARFGKTVIVTDNADWTTAEIVAASLDRWQVEDRFRQSKDDELVGAHPVRHWTDGKIRCHFFTCVVALTYLRRLELRLAAAGVARTAADVMDDMRHLHSVLLLPTGARQPRRRLETPQKTQTEVLKAFGWRIGEAGVLQAIEGQVVIVWPVARTFRMLLLNSSLSRRKTRIARTLGRLTCGWPATEPPGFQAGRVHKFTTPAFGGGIVISTAHSPHPPPTDSRRRRPVVSGLRKHTGPSATLQPGGRVRASSTAGDLVGSPMGARIRSIAGRSRAVSGDNFFCRALASSCHTRHFMCHEMGGAGNPDRRRSGFPVGSPAVWK
jgi:hypothetical protein